MSRRKNVDLHIHSTFSDGRSTPTEIIDMARARAVDTIAITDHDTVSAYNAELFEYAKAKNVRLISGIEFSSSYMERPVHILGLFIDTNNPKLLSTLSALCEERVRRAEIMVEKLRSEGFDISFSRIMEKASTSVGRAHIARELLECGGVDTISEAFDKYIGVGCRCYEKKHGVDIRSAIALINQAGGISVLAHPKLIEDDSIVNYVISCGINGIEVWCGCHSQANEYRYSRLARENHLLVSGGSDYHGAYASEYIGSGGIIAAQFNELLKRCYELRQVVGKLSDKGANA